MSRREECSHSVYFAQQMAGWCWESRDREIPKSAHHFVLYLIAGFNFYLRRFWVVFVAQLVERSILTPVVRNPIIGKFLCRTFVYCQTVLYQKGTNTEKEARNGPFLKKDSFSPFCYSFLFFLVLESDRPDPELTPAEIKFVPEQMWVDSLKLASIPAYILFCFLPVTVPSPSTVLIP